MNLINQVNINHAQLPKDSVLDQVDPELKKAAEGFEAVFLHTLLKQMRASSDVLAPEDNPLSSANQDVFRDMHDQQLGAIMAKRGTLGIAEMLAKQLGPKGKNSIEEAVSGLNFTKAEMSATLNKSIDVDAL